MTLNDLVALVEVSHVASIKGTLTGILSLINDPTATSRELKSIIQLDPPLVAKILCVANSPYYASSRTISAIDQALIWIGFDELKEIVLTQKMSELYRGNRKDAGACFRERLWRHSLGVALIAKAIFRREFGERGNNAYAAGLMHDLGVIVEDQFMHDKLHPLLCQETRPDEEANEKGIESSLVFFERSAFGFDHCMVGGELARRWGFPEELVEAIGFHHFPEKASPELQKFVKTIFIADCLMVERSCGHDERSFSEKELFERYCGELDLSRFALASIMESAMESLEEIQEQGLLIS